MLKLRRTDPPITRSTLLRGRALKERCRMFYSRATFDKEEEDYFNTNEDTEERRSYTDNNDSIFKKRQEKAAIMLRREKATYNDTVQSETDAEQLTAKNSEPDSLDMFMEQIQNELEHTTQSVAPTDSERTGDERFEEEDNIADFMEMLKSKMENRIGFIDSDDELELDENGYLKRKKDQQPVLPSVDHQAIQYNPFVKNIYVESEDLASVGVEARAEFRRQKRITVTGYKVPQPIHNFSQLKQTLEKRLLHNIIAQKWTEPTAVQAQLIPIALSGLDVISIAETGSGKTGGYLIPAIQHVCKVLDAWSLVQVKPGKGPIGLILSPTRELAMQTYNIARNLSDSLNLRVSCFCGGYDKTQQVKEIRNGVEISVGTPGRIIDLVTLKGSVQLSLSTVTFVVVDEADRMMELGFYSHIASIINTIRPDKQILLVSASLPSNLEALITTITVKPPVKLIVGVEGRVAHAVDQETVIFSTPVEKRKWLKNYVSQQQGSNNQTLIFCKSRQGTIDLCSQLGTSERSAVESHDKHPTKMSCLPATTLWRFLHGDMSQGDRHTVLTGFRNKRFPILIATDIAARGIDVPNCATVINYDTPKNWETYVHRVGRASSSGSTRTKGVAYSLFTKGNVLDSWMAGMLVETLKQAGVDPPRTLIQLALTHEAFRAAQLSGYSFFQASRDDTKRKKKKAMLGDVGCKGDVRRPTTPGKGYYHHFVRESQESGTEITTKTKRRWDSGIGSTAQHTVSVSLDTCKNEADKDKGKNVLQRDSVIWSAESKLPTKKAKVFSATDDIPSSSDDEDDVRVKRQVQPSLLKVRTSREIAVKLVERVRAAEVMTGEKYSIENTTTSSGRAATPKPTGTPTGAPTRPSRWN